MCESPLLAAVSRRTDAAHRERLRSRIVRLATGQILRSIERNRYVTGVTFVDHALWHGTWDKDASELRRIDAATREALENLEMPVRVNLSGPKAGGKDRFYCRGGYGGGQLT